MKPKQFNKSYTQIALIQGHIKQENNEAYKQRNSEERFFQLR